MLHCFHLQEGDRKILRLLWFYKSTTPPLTSLSIIWGSWNSWASSAPVCCPRRCVQECKPSSHPKVLPWQSSPISLDFCYYRTRRILGFLFLFLPIFHSNWWLLSGFLHHKEKKAWLWDYPQVKQLVNRLQVTPQLLCSREFMVNSVSSFWWSTTGSTFEVWKEYFDSLKCIVSTECLRKKFFILFSKNPERPVSVGMTWPFVSTWDSTAALLKHFFWILVNFSLYLLKGLCFILFVVAYVFSQWDQMLII